MKKPASKSTESDFGLSVGLRRLLIRCGFCSEEFLAELPSNVSLRDGLFEEIAKANPGATLGSIIQTLSKELALPVATVNVYQTARFVVALPDNKLIDTRSMRRLLYVPYSKEGGEMTFAVADPLNIDLIRHLEFLLQKKARIALASAESILSCVEHLDQLVSSGSLEIETVETTGEDDLTRSVADLSEEAGSAAQPVVRFVNQIVSEAAKARSSDIHLEPSQNGLEVRFRVDGVMQNQLSIPKKLQPYVTTRLKIMSGMDITEKRRPQDGRFRLRLPQNEELDIRSSTVPTPSGEKVVLRLLHPGNSDLKLEKMGLQGNTLRRFREQLHARERIVLVCGPTGSGKTTTLYAALSELNTGTNNIITIEDPIEIRIPGITQIQVDNKIDMTFASGLRSILRQDPDIVLLGEIRDLETAHIAFQAAQTGHLVLSTVHSNSAAGAVTRLRDIGLESYIISSALGCVLAQRLLRRLCPTCAEPDDKAIIDGVKQAVGCPDCGGIGYKGRVGIYSLLTISPEVRELIRGGASESEIEVAANSSGFIPLQDAGLELCRSGITSIDEIGRATGILVDNLLEQLTIGSSKLKARSKSPLPSVDILIIDDDSEIREILREVLLKSNFTVASAEDGIDALEALERLRPRLILSDLVMPRLDGLSFLKRLKGNVDHASIPVVILSGSDQEDNQIEGISEGAEDFISKSASPTLLVAKVKRVLERNS